MGSKGYANAAEGFPNGVVNSCSSVDEYEEAGAAGMDGGRSTMYEESILD